MKGPFLVIPLSEITTPVLVCLSGASLLRKLQPCLQKGEVSGVGLCMVGGY